MNQAVVAALADAMSEDPSVIVFGEDVAAAGGVFKTSEGLLDRFGPMRVRDTPISEMGFIGAAAGAAACGLRPVVELMFIEFLGVGLDQLVTEAAQLHYLSRGRLSIPMVVRASAGAGLGFGSQHSQTLERWILGSPGVKLCVPSGPESAYGLLRSAIADDNPVVVLEPRILYGKRADFDPSATRIGLGEARVLSSGRDVTVVGLGRTVGIAEEACTTAGDWSAELIDLSSLMPWDQETVLESAERTGRLVLVEENPLTGGWGATVASLVASELFGALKAPVTRVTAPDVLVPHGTRLESWYVPSAEYVSKQISHLVATDTMPRHWWEDRVGS
jgi:pyruvate dehydrogenase E1 component beta subunit